MLTKRKVQVVKNVVLSQNSVYNITSDAAMMLSRLPNKGLIVNFIKRTKQTEMHWQNRQRDTVRFERRNNEIQLSLVQGSQETI